MITPQTRMILFFGLLGVGSWACLGRDDHPAPIVAVSLPDSVAGEAPIVVTVYTFRGDCTVRTASARFEAVNDSTYELHLRQSAGTPGVGCPGGVWSDQFELAHPPARRFYLRFVGANSVEAIVNGGATPASRVRETFRFQGSAAPAPDSLALLLLGCHALETDYLVCPDTLGLVRADRNGIARFDSSCALDSVRYRAEVGSWGGSFTLEGEFHCGMPGQTILKLPN